MSMSTTTDIGMDAPRAPMTRWRAAGIHLMLSIAIGCSLVALMLLVWYPWPLFTIADGSGLVMILLGVDVVLGPLITLVIFKSGKKGLKFDLAVIAMLQLAALAYGVHAVYVVRPVYMVFNVDRFSLVAAVDLDPKDVAAVKREEFKRLPLDGPRYVAAPQPADSAQRNRILEFALAGKDIQLFPQQYVPYEQEARNALRRARQVDVLMQRDADRKIEKYLASAGRTKESVRFLPLRARTTDGVVLLDATTGTPLKIVHVDPW